MSYWREDINVVSIFLERRPLSSLALCLYPVVPGFHAFVPIVAACLTGMCDGALIACNTMSYVQSTLVVLTKRIMYLVLDGIRFNLLQRNHFATLSKEAFIFPAASSSIAHLL